MFQVALFGITATTPALRTINNTACNLVTRYSVTRYFAGFVRFVVSGTHRVRGVSEVMSGRPFHSDCFQRCRYRS